MKRILCVPLSTATSAVYFELGQFSIETMVKSNILKFFVRLKKDETNWSILKDILNLDCKWSKFCNQTIEKYEISIDDTIPSGLMEHDFRTGLLAEI